MLIIWNDYEYINHERCIRTYEIFYAPSIIVNASNDNNSKIVQWELITLNKHIPFLSYCHRVQMPNKRLEGMKLVVNTQCLTLSVLNFLFLQF